MKRSHEISHHNSVTYSFLGIPNQEQIEKIMGLYRAQGWWEAEDDCEEQLLRKLIAGSHCFAVASDESTILGMGRAVSDGVSDAYVQDLTVHRDYRNRGFGRRILKMILKRLQDDGIQWIGLIAEPGTSNFYRTAGFEEMPKSTPMLLKTS